MTAPLNVRETRLAEVGTRIDYFHDSSDEHLRMLGVDRALLPTRGDWQAFYEEDFARPDCSSCLWMTAPHAVRSRPVHVPVGRAVHARPGTGPHMCGPASRRMRRLEQRMDHKERSTAPNRTLQRAGFRFLFTHETTPSPINFPQLATRWVLD